MASNPFFSGRIPQELLDRVEKHVQETGESKTNILIQALATYLEFPIKPSSTNNSNLEKRVYNLEQQIVKLLNLDRDISRINQFILDRDLADNNVINIDNTETPNHLSCLEINDNKVITTDNQVEKWELIGEMNISEILKLPKLEVQDETKFRDKLKALNSSKREKITVVGSYKFKIIGKEPGARGKIVYEVYDNSDNT